MANNCFYTMKAVSKDENALKRLVEIMNYKDTEYYIYRCFSAGIDETGKEGDYFVYMISGDVAWAADHWFGAYENDDEDHTIENGAHYISLDLLCQRLGIAVEIYTEEPGCCFQEWIMCDHNGCVQNDTVEWTQQWEDEDGNDLDEPIEEGGFGDDYCNFNYASEIWGDDAE